MLGANRRSGGHRYAGGNDELLAGAIPHFDQRREHHEHLREHCQRGESARDCPIQVTPRADIHIRQG